MSTYNITKYHSNSKHPQRVNVSYNKYEIDRPIKSNFNIIGFLISLGIITISLPILIPYSIYKTFKK